MRITVISPFSFGYIDALVEELEQYPSVDVNFIQLEEFRFEYSNFSERVTNFFSKTFSGKNIKKEYLGEKIEQKILNQPVSDFILVIRPDKLTDDTLGFLKGHTNRLISYYFDAIAIIPKMESKLSFFDQVYSYEKEDVEKYNLNFISNFIPFDEYSSKKTKNSVFNISSYDERFPVLEAIAKQLKEQEHSYKILVRSKKGVRSNYIQIIDNYLPQSQTKAMIEEAGILLDIQKSNQKGLSFRVFEALGARKKLITTNSDIKEYDFYNPDNILVISKKDPILSQDFLKKPYMEIPEEVLKRYRRETWIKEVFGLKKKDQEF